MEYIAILIFAFCFGCVLNRLGFDGLGQQIIITLLFMASVGFITITAYGVVMFCIKFL